MMRAFLAVMLLLMLMAAGASWTQSHLGGWSMVHAGRRITWQVSSTGGTLALTWFSNVAEDDLYKTFRCRYWILEITTAIPTALAFWWWRRGQMQRHRRGFPVLPAS